MLRIKLQHRIRCETLYTPESIYSAPVVNYILEMWIDRVVIFDPDTGIEEMDHPAVPKELFLYRKLSEASDTYVEPLGSSVHIRIAEPEDLAADNPTRFGTENLVWSMNITPSTTLMAATTPAGVPLQRNDSPSAIAPRKPFCRSGYFKSRLFTFTSPDASLVLANYQSMKRTLTAFVQKYMASDAAVQETAEVWATKTF